MSPLKMYSSVSFDKHRPLAAGTSFYWALRHIKKNHVRSQLWTEFIVQWS